MMSGSRNLLWIIPLALLLGWPLYGPPLSRFLAPRGDVGGPGPTGQATKRFVMDDVVYLQEINGKTDWRIRANRLATTATNSDVMELTAVKGTLFRDGAENMQVGAAAGAYDTKAEVLTLRNNVEVLTASGQTIRTGELEYHEKERRISSRSPVLMTGKNLEIRGNGLEYNLRTRAYKVGGRVEVVSR